MFFCAKHFYIFYKKEMKKLLKWFTLVEILIVIVIIGILIWALVPRMQSAQWRARDVARKNDLSQLQAAILVSYQDKGRWPKVDSGYAEWLNISSIESEILAAWMNGVPQDPLSSNIVSWLWSYTASEWQYGYLVLDSYWAPKGWFALMAKTEVEGWSNWVVCENWKTTTGLCKDITEQQACPTSCGRDDTKTPACWDWDATKEYTTTADNWVIGTWEDIRDLKPCRGLTKDTSLNNDECSNDKEGHDCRYANESQLRYVLFN